MTEAQKELLDYAAREHEAGRWDANDPIGTKLARLLNDVSDEVAERQKRLQTVKDQIVDAVRQGGNIHGDCRQLRARLLELEAK